MNIINNILNTIETVKYTRKLKFAMVNYKTYKPKLQAHYQQNAIKKNIEDTEKELFLIGKAVLTI